MIYVIRPFLALSFVSKREGHIFDLHTLMDKHIYPQHCYAYFWSYIMSDSQATNWRDLLSSVVIINEEKALRCHLMRVLASSGWWLKRYAREPSSLDPLAAFLQNIGLDPTDTCLTVHEHRRNTKKSWTTAMIISKRIFLMNLLLKNLWTFNVQKYWVRLSSSWNPSTLES